MPEDVGRRAPWPAIPAMMATALLLASVAPGAAAADDMAVKMQWDDTLYRDEVSRVNLEITNIHDSRLMHVTSAGLYIDWMRLGTFEENTTPLQLESGERGVMTIFFRVPVDARYGKHSDYVVIRYSLWNETSGKWEDGTFESEITKDFTVVERPSGGQGWFAPSLTNPLCIAGVLVVVLVAAGAAARRARRRSRLASRPSPTPPEPSPGAPPPPPPAPAPQPTPVGKRPEGPEKCPYCGAPWPGKHCRSCGWDLG